MNKKRIAIIASISIIIASTGYIYFNYCTESKIKKIDSYTQVSDMLKTVDKNTLVLFDVDDTLIIPIDIMMRSKTKEEHQQWLKNTIDTIFKNAPHPHNYYEDKNVRAASMLVEPVIADIIKSLQQRGITVLALTAAWTGSFGKIPFFPEYRDNELKQLGIDFGKANIPDTTFKQLPERDGTYPMLYHGILCANLQDKGLVLGAFLDYTKWKPHHVIFFDDSYKRVKQVVDEMCKRGIPCTGYQYSGFEHVPGELDKELAIFQFKYLLEHEQWLHDDQAREMMKKIKTTVSLQEKQSIIHNI